MSNLEIRTEGTAVIHLTALMAIMGFAVGSLVGAAASYVNEEVPTFNGVLLWGSIGFVGFGSCAAVLFLNERMHDDAPQQQPPRPGKGKRKA